MGPVVDEACRGGTQVDERERRELRTGAGDAFSAAFELIATPGIFGLLGWLLDSRLGTWPVFTITFVLVVLSYEVWKLYVRYAAEMDTALAERRAGYGVSPRSGSVES